MQWWFALAFGFVAGNQMYEPEILLDWIDRDRDEVASGQEVVHYFQGERDARVDSLISAARLERTKEMALVLMTALQKMDSDNDGLVSRQEYTKAHAPGPGLDEEAHRKVEWGASFRFNIADENHDSVLELDELVLVYHPELASTRVIVHRYETEKLMHEIDLNNDEKASFEEWWAHRRKTVLSNVATGDSPSIVGQERETSQKFFHAMADSDEDGFLSLHELGEVLKQEDTVFGIQAGEATKAVFEAAGAPTDGYLTLADFEKNVVRREMLAFLNHGTRYDSNHDDL